MLFESFSSFYKLSPLIHKHSNIQTHIHTYTKTTSKKQFVKHKQSFYSQQYKKESELSKEVWNLKSANNNAEITWKIVRRCTL